MVIITNYEHIMSDKDHTGFMRCFTSENAMIDIELFSLFCWIVSEDENLSQYEKKFSDYEALISELEEIGYDFISQLNKYINHLSEELLEDALYYEIE